MRNVLCGTAALALIALWALVFSCEQAAGPIPKEEETPEQSEEPTESEPVKYAAAANGVNGEENSTLILFTFDEDVADLKAGNISLVNGVGDSGGGSVFKGALSGSGKVWSLGIAVQRAGSVMVAINKEGIEGEEKPVTVYRAQEQTLIMYNAAADGGGRRASSAINFTFGAAITDFSAEDITIAGATGSITTGALTGSGQNWSLGINVKIPGDIRVGIARDGIEAGERAVTVYKPVDYSAAADGEDGVASSAKIDFTFTAEIAGLTAGDISVTPADSVTKGALSGGGASWSLEIAALKAGDIQLSIHKDGIEEGEKTLKVCHYIKPIAYTAAANGVNGEEDSTLISFTFDQELADLRAGQLILAHGEGDTGGRVVKGDLSGSGKEWSLKIAVERAGSITVAINKTGVEAGEKPVALYKAQEQTIISYTATADGGSRRASSTINFTFGSAIKDLTAEDIALVGDTGSVVAGALSGSGQNWSLGIVVETPGNIRVGIAKGGIEAGEKTVAVYKPITYGITADGAEGLASSTTIDFTFAADVAGLTTGDISITPVDSVITGALIGGGTRWSLGIAALKTGDIGVRIQRDGIEDRENSITIHHYRPVSYTAVANGVSGVEDSTAIVFSFDGDLTDLSAEHISLVNGTGSVLKGALAGNGRQWFLGLTVQAAGSVRVAINKTGIEDGDKTVDVHKAAEQTLVSYSAVADGGARKASTAITFSFGAAVSLTGADIAVTGGTGSVTKGALSGNGTSWSLALTVETPGDIRVGISRAGIETGEKTVTLHKPLSYEAAADRVGGAEPTGRIDFFFSEAVEGLGIWNLRYADSTGSAYPVDFTGSGEEWSLTIIAMRTGDIKISIDKDGVEDVEKTIAVYKPEEAPPAVAVKTGILVITPPDTTLYAKNQLFDRTGLEIGWAYSDGSIEPIPAGGYTLEEPDMSRPSTKRVNVQAGSYTASFWIQVINSDKALVSISVEGPTNKTQDFAKEFDRTGLAVTGYYSDGSTSSLTSLAAIAGYDKHKRGPQAVSVKVNGKTAALDGIATRIGKDAKVTILRINNVLTSGNKQELNYKEIYIKGEAMTPRGSNIKFYVAPNGDWGSNYSNTLILSLDSGGLLEEDFATLTGFNPNQTGWQDLSITLDGRQIGFHVRVIAVEPAVWFDYGYMRHDGDPAGHGPGEGKYYAKADETLVIAPVRYLLGYNEDHSDAGVSYAWTVSGDNSSRTYTTSKGGELLHITPKTTGTYTINVSVTGRDYVSGSAITKTATTELVCYASALPAGAFVSPLRNFAPGQFTSGGSGYGWSLGSIGGYEVWAVEHQPSYFIDGNPFGAWHEPGVVWMQEDNNGNGLPDEMWYELRGGEDDDPFSKDRITRRYAVTYFKGDGTTAQNGTIDLSVSYWVDSKGRAGLIGPSAFPSKWGVTGDWVTYACTLLRDDGNIATANYSGLTTSGYVDTFTVDFPVNKAMSADGVPITLTAVKFIKVQTGFFRYGGMFGEISTEIMNADFLGRQTTFPKP
jgi:hypothetical protein